MKDKAIVVIGLILTSVFAVLSMATGMWGCGQVCLSFMAAFWVSLVMTGYGVYMHITARKRMK